MDISAVAKLDIRAARILEAEAIEGSDKLLHLSVDDGNAARSVVAGIAQDYAPADIKGKKVLLVANLKPVTLFGKESNGMLLAARKGKKGKLYLIELSEEIPEGAKIS